jgi:hypothetical protein
MTSDVIARRATTSNTESPTANLRRLPEWTWVDQMIEWLKPMSEATRLAIPAEYQDLTR